MGEVGPLRTTAVGVVAALMVASLAEVAPAAPSLVVLGPGLEDPWESGSVSKILDGDTLMASIEASSSSFDGTQRVRTIGINAPEVKHDSQPEQCGAAQAEDALRALLPPGAPLQLRALDADSYDSTRGRLLRSVYTQDAEGNWYDTARELVSAGHVLWFPRAATGTEKTEWAHNLEYRVLADDARADRRGLWSADLCGESPAAQVRLGVSWAQNVLGHEKVFVHNDGRDDLRLAGWTMRDTALNLYRFPSRAVVPAGGAIEVRMTTGDNQPAQGIFYAGEGPWFDNLPAENEYFEGDAVYLMDDAGSYQTGNLRAAFAYPCNPDDCRDPLTGSVSVVTPSAASWRTGQEPPSSPRQVDVTSGASGDLTVAWQRPTSVGDEDGITGYRVIAAPRDGSPPVADVVAARKRSTTLVGLTAGVAYDVTVAARNAEGWSTPSPPTGPVTPTAPPGRPRAVVALPGDGYLVVRWNPPASDHGTAITGYSVRATPVRGTGVASCQTVAEEQSCVVDGLANGTAYSVSVAAHNQAGTSANSTPSAEVTPAAAPPTGPPTPTAVTTTARDAAAVVTWTPAGSVDGRGVGPHVATATGEDGTHSCRTPAAGAASCSITGLANGRDYTVTVRALVGDSAGPASEPATVTPRVDRRSPQGYGVPTPAPPAWEPRETIEISNESASTVDLTGYGLWDKNTPATSDTPDYVFPRGTTVAAGTTLRVRSGSATEYRPANRTLHYTGKTRRFTKQGDRIELANMDKALVDCTAWGEVSCRGQRATTISTRPAGITARNAGRSLVVNWGVPISSGGTEVTGYAATAFDAEVGGNPVGTCRTDGSGRSCSIAGLTLGTTYYAEVVAENEVGTSAPSAPRVRSTQRTAPGAPGTVEVDGRSDGVRVSWTPAAANGAAVTGYTAAAYHTATGGEAVSQCSTDGGSVACRIPGLRTGTPYFIDVTATNREGAGAPSSPRTPGTARGLPQATSTYAKHRVTVRWDPPEPGASAITGYRARVLTKASGGTRVGTCTAAAGATRCRTAWLKERDTYYIALRVRAGSGSFTFAPRIVTGPPVKPTRPRQVTAAAVGSQVTIGWTAPKSNGYSPLVRYKARLYSKSEQGTVRAECRVGPTKSSCSVGPMPSRRYFAAVRVKNEVGWSPWTSRVKVVVP